LVLILVWGVAGLLSSLRALAQPAPATGTRPLGATTAPTTLPKPPQVPSNDIRSGDKPLVVDDINKFVNENVTRLATTEDAEVFVNAAIQAKLDLVLASTSPGPPQKLAVPSYLTPYVGALARALTGPATSPNVRVRVNVGVVAARVIDNCKLAGFPATSLQPLIITLLQDKNPGVALWGMKAAASLLTTGNPPLANPQVLKQILQTLSAHNFNGAITDEAYSALKDQVSNKDGFNAALQVFKARVEKYKSGEVPSDPIIERRPAMALTVWAGMFSAMGQADRVEVMNTIAALLEGAAAAMQKPGLSADVTEQLKTLIMTVGNAVKVVADNMNLLPLSAVSKPLGQQTPNAGNIVSMVAPVVEEIHKAFPAATQTAKQP
jgi:hypothetical protein